MKRRNGFTLIELLAVIVVLAVIALIATPIMIGIIGDAKKGAAKDSMYGYVKAVELSETRKIITIENVMTGTYTTQDGNLYQASTKVLDVNFKGTKPEDGGTVTVTNGQVTSAELTFDGIKVSYNGTEAIIVESGGPTPTPTPTPTPAPTPTPTPQVYTDGTAIYYNPVTGKKCNDYKAENSLNENKVGCMKWYAFNTIETSNTVNLILDHNTTYAVKWNSTQVNTEMKEVKEEVDKLVSVLKWKDTPRLIEANEIAKITGNTEFDAVDPDKDYGFYLDTNTDSSDPNKGKGTSAYKWLFDYTRDCTSNGCSITDNGTFGYWTSSPMVSYTTYAWHVNCYGHLYFTHVTSGSFGVRPVITVSKSVFS